MSVYKFIENRNFDKPLDLEGFDKIIKGTTICTGEGDYPKLKIDGYEGDKRWIAVKWNDNLSWTIYYGKAKSPFEYIYFNEKQLTDIKIVKELIDCTDEVLELYSYDG
jgi:hypothetical protein